MITDRVKIKEPLINKRNNLRRNTANSNNT